MLHRSRAAVAVVCALLVSAGCALPEGPVAAISVENCGATVGFDAPPERVTLLKGASVATLDALGVLDRVTAKAGQYPEEYYDDELRDRLAGIPTLTDQLDASGHLQISREVVVATEPDLVIGETSTVNRATLDPTGIPVVEEPAFCGALTGDVTFEDVYDQVRFYGAIFGRDEEAEVVVAELRARVAALRERAATDARTVAVLYPTIGGGVTYAYGTGSMSHPLVEAAGLVNVFADRGERVFEVSVEEIVARDPDVIVTLHSEGDAQEVIRAVTGLPGADAMTATSNRAFLPLLLNFAEPPSPLAVDGLERLVAHLDETR